MTSPRTLTALDRLRLDRPVWTVAALLQDLAGKSRKAIRDELRDNLRAWAVEADASEAIRWLGPPRVVAANYLAAEYGEGRPRPRWLGGMFWAISLAVLGIVGERAFVDRIVAASRNASGTYVWDGFRHWGPHGEVSLVDGETETARLTWPLIPWLLALCLAYGLGGRMWRTLGLTPVRQRVDGR